MPDSFPSRPDRPPRHQPAIDALLSSFRAAWQTGTRPRLEEYLIENRNDQTRLLRGLLQIEVRQRLVLGEQPRADEYASRFPTYADTIRDVWSGTAADEKTAAADEETAARAEETATWANAPQPSDTATWPASAAPPSGTRPEAAGSGPRLAGYELLEEIARGGMGVVYKARQLTANRIVALKMIRSGTLADQDEVKRFRAEAEAAASLDHPHIVPIHDVGEWAGQHYFSMGFVQGRSLKQALADGPLPPRSAAELGKTITAAVAYAHERGIVHRDLKPANILLDDAGQPRVADFGLAKHLAADSDLTATGAVMGTPGYMPPEQAAGKTSEAGPTADVYSLGAILYEMLTGRPPFQAPTALEVLDQVLHKEPLAPRSFRRTIPRDLETICLKCLAKEPRRRYQSGAELRDELDRFLSGKPIVARPVGTAVRLARWCRRNPSLAAAIGLAAMLLLLAVAGYVREARLRAVAEGERSKADQAARREAAAHQTARQSQRTAEARLAENQWDRALEQLQRGGIGRGLLWSVQALQTAPEGHAELRENIRTTISNWQPEIHPLRTCIPHDNPFTRSIRFSPDSRKFASPFRIVRLWDLQSGWELGVRFHHPDRVHCLAFSPDGRWLITGCGDRRLRFFDASSGALNGPPIEFDKVVDVALFSPDGSSVLAGNETVSGSLIDVESRALRAAGIPLSRRVPPIFSSDSEKLATLLPDHTVRILSARDGKVLVESVAPSDPSGRANPFVTAAAFDAEGDTLAVGTSSGFAQLFDTDTGEPEGEPLEHSDWIHHLAFNHGSGALAVATGGLAQPHRVTLWDVKRRSRLATVRHAEDIHSVCFSRDDQWLLTASSDKTAGIWNARNGEPIGQPLQHPDTVWRASFHANGRSVLTVCNDEAVRVWQLSDNARRATETEQLPSPPLAWDTNRASVVVSSRWRGTSGIYDLESARTLPLEAGPLETACFGSQGKVLVTTEGASGKVHEAIQPWSSASGDRAGPQFGRFGSIRDVVYSGDGERLAIAWGFGSSGGAEVWDLATGKAVAEELAHPQAVWSADLNHDGSLLATACFDGKIRVWDVSRGELLAVPLQHEGEAWAVRFAPDGETLVSGGKDRTVRFADVTGQTRSDPLKLEGEVLALAISPDGKKLVTGEGGRERDIWHARLWQLPSRRPMGAPMKHEADIRCLAFSPDGKRLASGAMDRAARLWDAESGELLARLPHESDVWSLCFEHSGKSLITASGRNACRIQSWNVVQEEPSSGFSCQVFGSPVVAAHPTKWLLATNVKAATQYATRFWDTRTRKPTGPTIRQPQRLKKLRLSSDGQLLAGVAEDFTVRVWNTADGSLQGKPLPHEQEVFDLQFSPRGDRLATACYDGRVRLWDPRTGKPLLSPLVHERPVYRVAFGPDGRRILSGSLPVARLWDVTSATQTAELRHEDQIRAVAFSRDGTRVATGSYDRKARIWDAASGAPLCPPLNHQGQVNSVAFSPDGKLLLTGGEGGYGRLWDGRSGRPVAPAVPLGGAVQVAEFSADGRSAWLLGKLSEIQRLNVHEPVEGSPAELLAELHRRTALALDEQGSVRALSRDDWEHARHVSAAAK